MALGTPWTSSARLALRALRAGGSAARQVTLATWRDRPRTGRALLVDLDNLGVPDRDVEATLSAVLVAAGPVRRAVAAGHPETTARLAGSCQRLGVQVLETNLRPQAADQALLGWAGDAAERGVGYFVLVSHDRTFARLPRPYEVLATGTLPVARLLAQRATQVRSVGVG